nr:hypothetical protein [Treponema sp.]
MKKIAYKSLAAGTAALFLLAALGCSHSSTVDTEEGETIEGTEYTFTIDEQSYTLTSVDGT